MFQQGRLVSCIPTLTTMFSMAYRKKFATEKDATGGWGPKKGGGGLNCNSCARKELYKFCC